MMQWQYEELALTYRTEFSEWEASVQRVWWLTFWHQLLSCDTAIVTSGKNKSLCDVLLLHQQKKLFSSIFCQAWAFFSFLCIWRVPRRYMEGLWRHCVRAQNGGGGSAKRSLVPSWGYCDGEEPRDSPFYRSIWDLLRCLVLQSNKSIFSFSEPQSWSLLKLSGIQIWTTAYHC